MKKHVVILVLLALALSIYFVVNNSNYVDITHKISVTMSNDFNQDYIQKHNNNYFTSIPEVYELLNIVLALSDLDGNTSLIKREGEYYHKVKEYFKNYSDHPVVEMVKEINNQKGYAAIRQIFAYEFKEGNLVLAQSYNNDYLIRSTSEIIKQLEDFARKSNFLDFYKNNESYYNNLIQLQEDLVPIKEIWGWLEKNFSIKHNHYKTIMSPLTYGSHNTFNYKDYDDDFSEIVMFISTPDILSNEYPEKVKEGLISRIVFTEIDHNYVNHVTNYDKNISKVMKKFHNLSFWNTQSNYSTPVLTFNEYMTWSTFLLYANETYSKEDYKEIEEATIAIMNRRGFIKFADFNNIMLSLYKEKSKSVEDLYSNLFDKVGVIN